MTGGAIIKIFVRLIKAGIITAYVGLIIILILQALTPKQESAEFSEIVGDKINDVTTGITVPKPEVIAMQGVTLDFVTASGNKYTETELTISLGSSGSIHSKITPIDATNKALDYLCSDSDIVTVTADGKISAKGIGSTNIIITSKENPELRYTLTVTVIEVPLESLKIKNPSKDFFVGEKHRLELNLKPSNTSQRNFSWESSDSAVLTVNKSGVVTANGVGTATVTVRSTINDQLYASIEIEVFPKKVTPIIPVESVSISSNDTTGRIGDKIMLTAKIAPANAVGSIIWYSSNEDIATVSQSGVVTLCKAGEVTITASHNDKISDSITITVKERLSESIKIETEAISATEDGYVLKQGKSGKVIAKLDENATVLDITYASSDDSIARISSDGTIEALNGGTVTITASSSYEGEIVSESFELTIDPLTFKDTVQNFYQVIRKSIGHFAAFLILGFLGAFTYYIIFPKKFNAQLLAVGTNIFAGFAVAGITEILQLPYFTEGRACSFDDVMLDLAGYCTAAIPIGLMILIFPFIIATFKGKKRENFHQ